MPEIPEPFLCNHRGKDKDGEDIVIEVYHNDSSYPNYFKCRVCGDEFPVIGDTDKWEPVMVDYDIQRSGVGMGDDVSTPDRPKG